jgi:hypothetical protein
MYRFPSTFSANAYHCADAAKKIVLKSLSFGNQSPTRNYLLGNSNFMREAFPQIWWLSSRSRTERQ